MIGLAGALALLLAAVAPAAAQAPSCEAGGSVCARTLSSSCLSRIGAGALNAQTVGADCEADLGAYLDCVAAIAENCPAAEPAPEPRAEAADDPLRRNFLTALAREFSGNLDLLDALAERMDVTGRTSLYERDWPELRTRFFEATDNPAYFYAPADWLADTQTFYDDMTRTLTDTRVRDIYRRGVTSTLYDRRVIRERFVEQLADARTRLLPLIEEAAQ